MIRSIKACATVVIASLAMVTGATAANASGVSHHNLSWESARVVGDGITARFHSNTPCPDRRDDREPIQGTREVFVTVSFSFGGAMTQGPIPVAANGSWSAELRFLVDRTVKDRAATVTAECDDVTFTGFLIASYRPHPIMVNP
jgi:hypothetical protein